MPQFWSLITCKTEAQPQQNTCICATVSFTNIQMWKQLKCREMYSSAADRDFCSQL